MMFYNFAKNVCRIFLKLFLPIHVIGVDNIPSKGAFILAGNHLSYLDPVVFGAFCFRSLCYLAKAELFKNPFFGWLLRKVNAFPLKRNASDVSAIKEALRHLNAGKGIILFPEGTRSDDARVKKGLGGVGFLSRKANVPIVPAFIKGTDKALPKKAKFVKRYPITVVYGKPIICDDRVDDVEMAAFVMKAIARLDPDLKEV